MSLFRPTTLKEYFASLNRRADRRAKRQAKGRVLFGVRAAMSKSDVKASLWEVVSLYVRLRDLHLYGNRCRIGGACRGRGLIECAYHLVPSNDGAATRYDPENIVGACHACNYGEQRHRHTYSLIHESLFGKESMDRLREKSKVLKKYSRAELFALRDQFKSMIENRRFA